MLQTQSSNHYIFSTGCSWGQSCVQLTFHRNGGGGSCQCQWCNITGARRNQGLSFTSKAFITLVYFCLFLYLSNNNPLNPQEKNRAGDIVGSTEKTSTDKKRERRLKRKAKRLKIKEKEKRQKLKEASKSGQNKKPSQAEIRENLKKLTKGGKATLIKVSISM